MDDFPSINRELSWLDFNDRVLDEAFSEEVPLLERLNFFSIFSSNLEEFFMIRVGGLHRQIRFSQDAAGQKVIEQILEKTRNLINKQNSCVSKLLGQMDCVGIHYKNDFSRDEIPFLKDFFDEKIFPILTPLRIGKNHYTQIEGGELYAFFELESTASEKKIKAITDEENGIWTAILIPKKVENVIPFPNGRDWTLWQDVILLFAQSLFVGYEIKDSCLFKLTRDASTVVPENEDLLEALQEVLKKRKRAFPVKLEHTKTGPHLVKMLQENFGLNTNELFEVENFFEHVHFKNLLPQKFYLSLKNSLWKPREYPDLYEKKTLWKTLRKRDILLHFPYDSFNAVESFLKIAATDKKVLSIKMTLYRTTKNSPLLKALALAKENGKQVTVFVEVRARFDEKQNIDWVKRLEKKHIQIVYKIENLKVHAKTLQVVRRDSDKIRCYSYLSTGNFNEKTARLYSDFALFTTNEAISADLLAFSNVISGYSAVRPMKSLAMSPVDLREKLITLIEGEAEAASQGHEGLIMAKVNSLADERIVAALYKAASVGVKILLNVRGICTLVPGVPGLSENIRVVSIVDRFLEHSRIMYFRNGGDEKIFLSSADWLPRNFDKRIELLFPIFQNDLKARLKKSMEVYLNDTEKGRYLQSDGTWRKAETVIPESRAQERFLSGEI